MQWGFDTGKIPDIFDRYGIFKAVILKEHELPKIYYLGFNFPLIWWWFKKYRKQDQIVQTQSSVKISCKTYEKDLVGPTKLLEEKVAPPPFNVAKAGRNNLKRELPPSSPLGQASDVAKPYQI